MRTVVRYWYVIPLLFVVVSLQIGLGLVTVHGETAAVPEKPQTEVSLRVIVSTPLPYVTRASGATVTPPLTPSPTVIPAPTDTPTVLVAAASLPPAVPAPSANPTPGLVPPFQDTRMQVPILMYHYVSVPPPGSDAIRHDLSVTPVQFEAHLAYLRQAGYETVPLARLAYILTGQAPRPDKPIVLTFDDGYRDNYEYAFPLLHQYGYSGTFFPVTLPIDQNHPSYLTWDMVAEMHRAGMEFGSHSYRHSDLSGRDADFLVYEILGSKEAIEARIGEPVLFFSYPAGRYDDFTIQVLESAHFWGAVTTEWGVEQSFNDRFELVRLRVRGSDTAAHLAEKLNGF